MRFFLWNISMAVAALLVAASPAWASRDDKGAFVPLASDRTEWAAVPIIAGSTDIGFQFGGLVAFTNYSDGVRPFWWKTQIASVASVKDGPKGIDFPQHLHGVRFDVPGLLDGDLRLVAEIGYERTINAGYFGVGNASSAEVPHTYRGKAGRRNQFIYQEIRNRLNGQVHIAGGLSLRGGVHYRYLMPEVYGGSQLDEDRLDAELRGGAPVLGTSHHGIVWGALGALWDSRDDEIKPTSGMTLELSGRLGRGAPADDYIFFGGVNAEARGFVPIIGPALVLAGRVTFDGLFGDVPFYELSRAWSYDPNDFPAGPKGIRGVPVGRYAGRVKLVASFELRTTLFHFHPGGHHIRLGAVAFGDTGRVWAGWEQDDVRDGKGAGLAYGVGAGIRFGWGESVLLRLDFAYSPDARDAGGAPIGVYFAMDHAF